MYVVVHEGTSPKGGASAIAGLLGPDGEVARERRLTPGYLGSLLLLERPALAGESSFVLLEMWDDRTGPVSGSASPGVGTSVAWKDRPRVFVAVR
ncbi:MAG: hypothetical protein MUE82_07080 [Chloroflexi bacterium]|jgi:hypothetical protein|nr:hypothetical protein [Chloroflexota bacterium]